MSTTPGDMARAQATQYLNAVGSKLQEKFYGTSPLVKMFKKAATTTDDWEESIVVDIKDNFVKAMRAQQAAGLAKGFAIELRPLITQASNAYQVVLTKEKDNDSREVINTYIAILQALDDVAQEHATDQDIREAMEADEKVKADRTGTEPDLDAIEEEEEEENEEEPENAQEAENLLEERAKTLLTAHNPQATAVKNRINDALQEVLKDVDKEGSDIITYAAINAQQAEDFEFTDKLTKFINLLSPQQKISLTDIVAATFNIQSFIGLVPNLEKNNQAMQVMLGALTRDNKTKVEKTLKDFDPISVYKLLEELKKVPQDKQGLFLDKLAVMDKQELSMFLGILFTTTDMTQDDTDYSTILCVLLTKLPAEKRTIGSFVEGLSYLRDASFHKDDEALDEPPSLSDFMPGSLKEADDITGENCANLISSMFSLKSDMYDLDIISQAKPEDASIPSRARTTKLETSLPTHIQQIASIIQDRTFQAYLGTDPVFKKGLNDVMRDIFKIPAEQEIDLQRFDFKEEDRKIKQRITTLQSELDRLLAAPKPTGVAGAAEIEIKYAKDVVKPLEKTNTLRRMGTFRRSSSKQLNGSSSMTSSMILGQRPSSKGKSFPRPRRLSSATGGMGSQSSLLSASTSSLSSSLELPAGATSPSALPPLGSRSKSKSKLIKPSPIDISRVGSTSEELQQAKEQANYWKREASRTKDTYDLQFARARENLAEAHSETARLREELKREQERNKPKTGAESKRDENKHPTPTSADLKREEENNALRDALAAMKAQMAAMQAQMDAERTRQVAQVAEFEKAKRVATEALQQVTDTRRTAAQMETERDEARRTVTQQGIDLTTTRAALKDAQTNMAAERKHWQDDLQAANAATAAAQQQTHERQLALETARREFENQIADQKREVDAAFNELRNDHVQELRDLQTVENKRLEEERKRAAEMERKLQADIRLAREEVDRRQRDLDAAQVRILALENDFAAEHAAYARVHAELGASNVRNAELQADVAHEHALFEAERKGRDDTNRQNAVLQADVAREHAAFLAEQHAHGLTRGQLDDERAAHANTHALLVPAQAQAALVPGLQAQAALVPGLQAQVQQIPPLRNDLQQARANLQQTQADLQAARDQVAALQDQLRQQAVQAAANVVAARQDTTRRR